MDVYIHSKTEKSSTPQRFDVALGQPMSIKQLKELTYQTLQIPVGIQYWIINNEVRLDSVKLNTIPNVQKVILYIVEGDETSFSQGQLVQMLNRRYSEILPQPKQNYVAQQQKAGVPYELPPPPAGWGCPLCKTINKMYMDKCAKCPALRDDHIQQHRGWTVAAPSGTAHRDEQINNFRDTAPTGWTCPQCKSVNAPNCTQCACSNWKKNAPTPQCSAPSSGSVPTGSGWTCPRCTMFNKSDRPGCEVCSASRPDDVEGPSGWTCSQCTMFNKPDRPGCEMCSATRPDNVVPAVVPAGWSCPRCTKVQPLDHPSCDMCSERRPNTALRAQNAMPVATAESKYIQWKCPNCTLENEITRPSCAVCSSERPHHCILPDGYTPQTKEEKERLLNEKNDELEAFKNEMRQKALREYAIKASYSRHLQIDDQPCAFNTEVFECPICYLEVEPGNGVTLRTCFHSICRECMRDYISKGNQAEVKCPCDGCDALMEDREIRGVCTKEDYERYSMLSQRQAEAGIKNSFHCKTPDCNGWVIYEELNNFFECPVCEKQNCLTCAAIHEGMDCKQYQEDMRLKAANDESARKSIEAIEGMVQRGEAMHCPGCKVIVQKKDGCSWIMCTMCKTEICWATLGPRWGPKGRGDESGGCGCRVNGKRCHPQCGNCH